jgi:hypothetical protein
MKAYLIDPAAFTVSAIDPADTLHDLYRHIGCEMVT